MTMQAIPRAAWLISACLGMLVAFVLLPAASARAENLDSGKSAARLFAETCANCHHSARGLAKGRFRLSLFLFMRQHFASNSASAWALASYLDEVGSGNASARASLAMRTSAANRPGQPRPPAGIPVR